MATSLKEIIKSLGIVFGDIGTSPIYTLTVAFSLIPATLDNVTGILSLIIWTLILLVSVQYAWLAMSLGDKGEGGTIVLKELLIPLLTSKKQVLFVTFLAFLGISFFIGDGIITPAISILSAVEGLDLVPGLHGLRQEVIVIIACIITVGLFIYQKRGIENVSNTFGPIMLVWFSFLGISGFLYILKYPYILISFNPYHAVRFLAVNKFAGFLLLSKVILSATGGEALYADMGHLGRKPIIAAWGFTLVTLCLNYLGQGVFLLQNPFVANVFYEMTLIQWNFLYIPLLFLSIVATVIASQAMISGIFSIVYQGITTHIMPRLHVEYTSRTMMSQIYIPSINWSLMLLVLFTIIRFKYSYNLAEAYGLAASATMTITALFLSWIFLALRNYLKGSIAVFIALVNILFLASNTFKIPTGGYISLLFASIPFLIIVIYTSGQRKLYKSLKPMPLSLFLEKYLQIFPQVSKIKGTAVFLSKNVTTVPMYVAHTMFTNTIIYEENIIISVITQEKPFGISGFFKEDLAQGLKVFEIKMGYMEIMNIEKILNSASIHPKVIFYGVEDITTNNIIWKVFTLIKKLTPSFVQFYKLPVHKLHGVIVRVEM